MAANQIVLFQSSDGAVSLPGVEFRRWATSVLKEYVLRGYAINRKRLVQLGQAVKAAWAEACLTPVF